MSCYNKSGKPSINEIIESLIHWKESEPEKENENYGQKSPQLDEKLRVKFEFYSITFQENNYYFYKK